MGDFGYQNSDIVRVSAPGKISESGIKICFLDMWAACCRGAKSIDFKDSPQPWEKEPLIAIGLAREGKPDILASAWPL